MWRSCFVLFLPRRSRKPYCGLPIVPTSIVGSRESNSAIASSHLRLIACVKQIRWLIAMQFEEETYEINDAHRTRFVRVRLGGNLAFDLPKCAVRSSSPSRVAKPSTPHDSYYVNRWTIRPKRTSGWRRIPVVIGFVEEVNSAFRFSASSHGVSVTAWRRGRSTLVKGPVNGCAQQLLGRARKIPRSYFQSAPHAPAKKTLHRRTGRSYITSSQSSMRIVSTITFIQFYLPFH
jgi:hypothetical protein